MTVCGGSDVRVTAMQPGDENLQEAVTLACQGQVNRAFDLLQKITAQNPENAQAWMWLAHVSQTHDEKRAALRRVLLLQPDNTRIRAALHRLTSPSYIQNAIQNGVFIGYARADELFAVDISDSLREHGIKSWLDMTEISTDSTWFGSVTRALRKSGLVLLVLSPAALRSEELRHEIAWYLQTGKLIVPVMHQPCDIEAFGLTVPPVDFSESYAVGLQNLLELLGAATQAGHSA